MAASTDAAAATAAPSRSHLRDLARVVRNNLEHQQDWTQLQFHGDNDNDGDDVRLPRVLLSGLPPRRMYVHPDEQIAILRAEQALGSGRRIPQPPEYEWVLPMHLAEAASIAQFAAVFDAIEALPPAAAAAEAADDVDSADDAMEGDNGSVTTAAEWKQWRGSRRGKRLLLAIVQDDSTVVYYFMHDGMVKPRQN